MQPGKYIKSTTFIVLFCNGLLSPVSLAETNDTTQTPFRITTSANPESNSAHSFIVVPGNKLIPEGIKLNSQQQLLALQIPFIIELTHIPQKNINIQWQIKVVSDSYGQVDVLSKFPGTQNNTSGTTIWTSKLLAHNIYERHKLVFRPRMKKHRPAIYKKGKGRNGKRRKYGGGTQDIDDEVFNPGLSYLVSVKLLDNKKIVNVFETSIAMDKKDMIRQEYINHYDIKRYGRGENGNIPVPRRDEISEIPANINIIAGNPLTESKYGLLVNDGMHELASQIAHSYELAKLAHKKSPLIDLNKKPLTTPDSNLWISGGWRNPERNEWYSNALNGIHQRGGAIDIIVSEPPGHPNTSIAYWLLWNALEANRNNINGFWQLETNGRPMTTREFEVDIEPQNGIPDAFDKADHLHANIRYKEK